MARSARAVHLRTSGIRRMYSARTSVTRSRSRRRGNGFLCYCCKPQGFQVNPLLDMRTDRRSGISRSNRDSSDQGNSMGLPVREYTGSPNKPLHSECAYREGVNPICRITPTVNSGKMKVREVENQLASGVSPLQASRYSLPIASRKGSPLSISESL